MHVIRFGNPAPQAFAPVTFMEVPDFQAAPLLDSVDLIHAEQTSRGDAGFREHLLTETERTADGHDTVEWKVACRHILACLRPFHHAGVPVTWIACEDNGLRASLQALLGGVALDRSLHDALELAHTDEIKTLTEEIEARLRESGDPTAVKFNEARPTMLDGVHRTSSRPEPFKWIGLSPTASGTHTVAVTDAQELYGEWCNTAPSSPNSHLTELSYASALLRAEGTYTAATTEGENGKATLAHTFTANKADEEHGTKTANKVGVMNSASAAQKTACYGDEISALTWTHENDNGTVTYTLKDE